MAVGVLLLGPGLAGAGELIFADGFETGSTERWSSSILAGAAVVHCSVVSDIQMINEIAFQADWGYVPNGNGTITVGGEALWVHAAGNPWEHNITSGVAPVHDGRFQSIKITDHGARICVRFLAPGVYPYFCSVHPASGEQATITVP